MTGAAAMTVMTEAAEARLHDYLQQVQEALHAHPDVSPDDVAADVREHIDTEFAQVNRPVTLGELESVLARLGPPGQWAATGVSVVGLKPFDWGEFFRGLRGRFLGVLNTLWKGPEDWRLPYIAFGLTLLAPITLGISALIAYFLARATVELAHEKGQPLGARRWLVYPAIVAVSLPLMLATLFGPAMILGNGASIEYRDAVRLEKSGWIDYNKKPIEASEKAEYETVLAFVRHLPGSGGHKSEVQLVGFTMIGVLAFWWTLLGIVMWVRPAWPRMLFHPFQEGANSSLGLKVATGSFVILLIWVGYAFRICASAGIG